MATETERLVFRIGQMCCALPLENTLRVEQAVEITPLPDSPATVAGVINVRGRILPVMNVRCRMGLDELPLAPQDQFILAKSEKREMALWVEQVDGVLPCNDSPQQDVADTLAALPTVSGVTAIGGDLILIHDLEQFLSDAEDEQLARAMDSFAS